MAEVMTSAPPASEGPPAPKQPPSSLLPARQAQKQLRDIYALPVPIQTFPLPSFYPSNPISVFHVLYSWLTHVLSPPPSEPSVVHTGVWSPTTRSVHIQDPKSIRALWEQGFYGKGNLSRSEPNWLKREQIRQGLAHGDVSEEITVGRRKRRISAKWERARAEQEAIEQTRLAEAQKGPNGTANGHAEMLTISAPVGPLELLALPNSDADVISAALMSAAEGTNAFTESISPNGVLPDGPNGITSNDKSSVLGPGPNDHTAAPDPATNGKALQSNGLSYSESNGYSLMNGHDTASVLNGKDAHRVISDAPNGRSKSAGDNEQPLKRQKSVRFSPQVQSTTFLHSDPPSPNHSAPPSVRGPEAGNINGVLCQSPRPSTFASGESTLSQPGTLIVDKEHLQLSPEEAFFLVFGLGALQVIDPTTRTPVPPETLLSLFRSHSYFPPRISSPDLQPDDGFLVNYAVYHHYRSLGWVPRHGMKFGVDWLLYLRGPVFDHAEFGLVLLPSYSDPRWGERGRASPRRSWHWLHGTTRVLSHVVKSLVLVYVDVPSPEAFAEAAGAGGPGGGIAEALKRYRIREVMVRKWSSNRNRS